MGCCDSVAVSPQRFSQHILYKSLSHTGTHNRMCTHIEVHTLYRFTSPAAGNSTVRCRDQTQRGIPSISNLQFCSQSSIWAEERGWWEESENHISSMFCFFLSVVCMACRLELNKACVASGCRATGTIGRSREEWCQRNTQSDIGTARKICLRRWSQHPAWYIHAWYNG